MDERIKVLNKSRQLLSDCLKKDEVRELVGSSPAFSEAYFANMALLRAIRMNRLSGQNLSEEDWQELIDFIDSPTEGASGQCDLLADVNQKTVNDKSQYEDDVEEQEEEQEEEEESEDDEDASANCNYVRQGSLHADHTIIHGNCYGVYKDSRKPGCVIDTGGGTFIGTQYTDKKIYNQN